jgi:acylphosphatase
MAAFTLRVVVERLVRRTFSTTTVKGFSERVKTVLQVQSPRTSDYFFYSSFFEIMQGILLSMIEMYAVVAGKVQGVRYRTYVQESATGLSLAGYVKNLPDGTVEVVAQGLPDTLKEFVEFLNEGSLLAKVESVSIDWRSVRVTYDDFSVFH